MILCKKCGARYKTEHVSNPHEHIPLCDWCSLGQILVESEKITQEDADKRAEYRRLRAYHHAESIN